MKRTLLALLFAGAGLGPALLSSSSQAHADANQSAIPQRLVGTALSSAQALLWDGEQQAYILVKVGDDLGGGHVVALEADAVTIERDGVREMIELLPPPTSKLAARRNRRMPALLVTSPQGAALLEEKSAAAPAAPMPTTIQPPAPAAPIAPPAPAAAAAPNAPPAPAATIAPPPPAAPPPAPAAITPEPAPAPAPAPVAAPDPAAAPPQQTAFLVPRSHLTRTIDDGFAPGRDVIANFEGEQGVRLAQVKPGSFLAKVGLRSGDLVTSVDGRPLRSAQDGMAAVAWLRIADQVRVELLRNGQPVTFQYVFAAN